MTTEYTEPVITLKEVPDGTLPNQIYRLPVENRGMRELEDYFRKVIEAEAQG